MKISREWLQTFFEKPLPEAKVLADALTFHAFEIESVENDILDVKVTPNRGHDCLSYRGIAKEISAILGLQLTAHPYEIQDISLGPKTDTVSISIQEPALCARYIAGHISGVKVGPSPKWLVARLSAMGQQSINNVVDATNFVMFGIGQPLHAFDAGQLVQKGGKYSIAVRKARQGEKMLALDDKEYALSTNNLVIVDGNTDATIGIAGVKGGKPAGITESTTEIIIESANFDGAATRRTASALKLRTDASERFQQVISAELAAYGMRAASELIQKLAGGELLGFVDEYPRPQDQHTVSVSLDKINAVLGTSLSKESVVQALQRLDFKFEANENMFLIHQPFDRLDITIAEDIAEEVARIVGYDSVPSVELPRNEKKPEINAKFAAAEHTREDLMSKGYSEVYTSVFSDKGERAVANKIGGERPYLRANLTDGLQEAMEKNIHNRDVLGLSEIRIFEIGSVWKAGKEITVVGSADSEGVRERKLAEIDASAYEELTISETEQYKPFSRFPSITRDIALWVPGSIEPSNVESEIRDSAGDLLVRIEQFDRFEKAGKTSLAFRLVFQSFDRTLTDEDANSRMQSVYAAVKKEGWEVR